jgi:hypothetical protein
VIVTGGAGRVQAADCRLVLMMATSFWGGRLGQSRTKGGEGAREGKIDGRMMNCVEVDDSSHEIDDVQESRAYPISWHVRRPFWKLVYGPQVLLPTPKSLHVHGVSRPRPF